MSRPKRDTKRITFLCPVTHLAKLDERIVIGKAQTYSEAILQSIYEANNDDSVKGA